MRCWTVLILTLVGAVGCATLPPNTPTTFRTYSNASHQRIETLQRVASGLNLDRSKSNDAVIELESAVSGIDPTKSLNDPANAPALERIKAMIAVMRATSKPDRDVSATLARIDNDREGLAATADVIYAVLYAAASRQSNAGGVLDAASRIITDLNEKNAEAAKRK